MKQFCRIYLRPGGTEVVAVYTNSANEPPEVDPIAYEGMALDTVDVELDAGEAPYIPPAIIRRDVVVRDGMIRAKATGLLNDAVIKARR